MSEKLDIFILMERINNEYRNKWENLIAKILNRVPRLLTANNPAGRRSPRPIK